MKTISKNNNSPQLKSTDELKQIMKTVLSCATRHGATDAAVSVGVDGGFSVDVRMQSVESVTFSEDKGVSVTVYIGQRKGSASSSDTSQTALETMVVAACDIAKVSAEDPCFGLPDRQLIQYQYPDLDLYHPAYLTPEQAIHMGLTCEKEALAIDKRLCNSDGVSVSSYEFYVGYATTQDFLGEIRHTRHHVTCSLLAESQRGMQRDHDYTTGVRFSELVSMPVLAQRAAERTLARLGAQKIKTQNTPVLFSSRVSSGLFSLLISAISGHHLYRKNSFLLDALGEQIFPASIRVHEQPHRLGGLGSTPFDNDGLITRPNVFVDQGRLQQYVLSTYTARRLGLETTANAGGVSNLTIDPTDGDLNALLKKMDRGLLVTELMGQGINILTGDYSRGASGFWVENGQIQYPVEEVTIAGNLRQMFQNIVAVGTDIDPNLSTRCGSVLVSDMMLAGS